MSALTGTSQVSAVTQTSGELQDRDSHDTDLPKANEQALQFLNNLYDDDYSRLVFDDRLVTVSDAGRELGEFVVSVQLTKYEDGTPCFLVHASSQGAIDNVPCGTSITSYVTPQLVTLEQQHHEFVKLENHPLDRKTILVKQDEEYVINRVINQGEDVQRRAKSISCSNMKGFISEGSNLLLLRLLVKKGLPDDIQFLSLDSEANICPATYRALEQRKQVIQEREIETKGIERTIHSATDLSTSWHAYFTKEGYLTSRVQVGSPVTMRLTTLPDTSADDDSIEKPVFGKKPLNWEDDMQLYSKFMDRKDELKGDHAVYMRQHPELQAMLADFMQFLLLRKPDDVVAFTADYFSSFSTKMPNSSPYLQSSTLSSIENSRSSPKVKHLAQSQQCLPQW